MITRLIATCLLLLCAALHGFFVYGEMIPRENGLPAILDVVLKERGQSDGELQPKDLVVTIVQNAGAYNVIMTLGFILAAAIPYFRFIDLGKHGVTVLQGFFCIAAIWAGIYGMSLSPKTKWQAILGAVSLLGVVVSSRAQHKNNAAIQDRG